MRLLVLVVVVGCGSVSDKKVDARMADTSSPGDGSGGSDASGLTCTTDMFDGTTLQTYWNTTQGGTPTYMVSGGKLVITDSPPATTPSNTNESWLNNLDTDKGNQLAWPQAIGGQDFRVSTHIDWNSTNAELTWAGIAVADAQGVMAAIVGARDGGQGNAIPHAQLNFPGSDPDTTFGGTEEQPGAADFQIERVNNVIRFYIDGIEVHSGASSALISHAVIFHVPYRLNTTNYAFGTVEFTHIEVCK